LGEDRWTFRGLRWSGTLPVAVAGLGVLFLLAHLSLKPVVGDEGVTAVDAWRLLSGQVPHRDYFEVIPPLSAGVLSWTFRLFGVGVSSVRGLGFAYGVVLLLLTWALARRFCLTPLYQALPLAVLVPFGAGAWPFPSHHWLADLFCLGALLALAGASEGSWTFSRAAVGGGAIAAACFTLQDQGGLALLAALLPLPWIGRDFRKRYLSGLVLGGLAVAAAVSFLWLPPDPGLLGYDWFAFPALHYRQIPENAVGLMDSFSQLLGQWDPVALRIAPLHAGAVASASMLLFALPFCSLAGVWPLWRDRSLPRPVVVLLVAFTAASLGTALHRWSLMNLIWAIPIPAVAVAAALSRAPESWPSLARKGAVILTCTLLGVFLSAGILRGAFVLRNPGHKVTGLAGAYRTFNSHEAESLQGFLDAIETRVPRGEGAFVRGFIPLVSFLSLRPNPTPFTCYIPSLGYQTPAQAERLCRSIEERHVRWGISSDTPFDPTDPADVYLSARYRVVWRNGTYALLERRP